MKVLVLGATGGTGRLIVRFRPGERPGARLIPSFGMSGRSHRLGGAYLDGEKDRSMWPLVWRRSNRRRSHSSERNG